MLHDILSEAGMGRDAVAELSCTVSHWVGVTTAAEVIKPESACSVQHHHHQQQSISWLLRSPLAFQNSRLVSYLIELPQLPQRQSQRCHPLSQQCG